VWQHDLGNGLRILRLGIDPPDHRPPPAPAPHRPAGGQHFEITELALEHGFTDVDGSQPDVWRYIEEVTERGLEADPADYR
jgi:hypothetical protein